MPTTQVRERPILFSAPMVLALLDGRKTQTRRVVKPQPGMHDFGRGLVPAFIKPAKGYMAVGVDAFNEGTKFFCPYGVPGDRLYCKETWGYRSFEEAQKQIVTYKADTIGTRQHESMRWRPSIHMPRWASRLTLTITDVRVQRVQDISEEDAIAEGCQPRPTDGSCHLCPTGPCSAHQPARGQYKTLWDSINGTGSWASNLWVWAITFEVVK